MHDTTFKNIEYKSESVDITQKCCQYLIENNYYQNNKKTNFNLLEKALINYSILKFKDFNIDVEKIDLKDWDNLSEILKELDKCIPTLEDKRRFFAQYNHCIVYIHSSIQQQEPMKLEINDNVINSFKTPTAVVLAQNLPEYEKTLTVFNLIKEMYVKENNLILHK